MMPFENGMIIINFLYVDFACYDNDISMKIILFFLG